MRAGKLRHRVTIKRPNPDRDTTTGEVDQQFVAVEDRWAEVDQMDGDERIAAEQAQSTIPYRVRLRYFIGLGVKHRLEWEGKLLGIVSVAEDARKQEQICVCREVN